VGVGSGDRDGCSGVGSGERDASGVGVGAGAASGVGVGPGVGDASANGALPLSDLDASVVGLAFEAPVAGEALATAAGPIRSSNPSSDPLIFL
jgi:hypothetical protein